ncbi:MAG TPA: ABC transporter permease [Candidatus Sulfotelmatobacter sp.]|nr:ABC transporter permease [Candidatus Sulfotelmatobacter sp.]
MHTLLQDLRYSARQLIKSPGFTLTAVISLALGIGAATAVFSVIYAVLMHPYPYPAADRIVRLTVDSVAGSGDPVYLNGGEIQTLRQSPVVESVLASDNSALMMTSQDLPETVHAVSLISKNFQDLGVPALLGRGLWPSDAVDGQEPRPVVVLSYRFWRRHYLSNPDVVGRTLQLDHRNFEIVGVAAPRFTWYDGDVYLPLKLLRDPGRTSLVNLLLRPGVSHATADAALQPLVQQFANYMPQDFPADFRVHVQGLNDWVVNSMGGTLYLLFGAVMLLLVIGCGNVSILLLARGTARQHELAVRTAIGAGRLRIIRQLLTESLLLALIGALLGVLASYGALVVTLHLVPQTTFASEAVIRINLPVLFFSVTVALGTGVLFGLWPALQLSRTHIGEIMQTGARRLAGSVSGRKAHSMLITTQVALTLLLLAAAGSSMKGFAQLIRQPLGYDPHNVMAIWIPLRAGSYGTWPTRAGYFEQLREKVAETPGVITAAISTDARPPRNGWTIGFDILGVLATNTGIVSANLISPQYFAALRIPLLQGRIWSDAENNKGAHVAVINRALAQRYFPNGDAIGHSLRLPGIDGNPATILSPPNIGTTWLQIVGIVQDARNDGLRSTPRPSVYVPYTFSMGEGTEILVRSEVSPITLQRAVCEQLRAINPDQISGAYDLETRLTYEPEWQQEHVAAWIFGIFAWLALALGAVGLHSVVSYTVAQRTNEFGIRMALGAQRADVLRMVFRAASVSLGAGILAGIALSFALNHIIVKWVQVNPRDPGILLAGTILLGFVSGVACAIPARRASKVDPMIALRSEE